MLSRLIFPNVNRISLFSSVAVLLTFILTEAAPGQDSASCVGVANRDIGSVHHLAPLPDGGVLASAANGVLLVRSRDGQLSMTRAGDAGMGRATTSHPVPAGALIGTQHGLFLARFTSDGIKLAAVKADTGFVFELHDLPGAGVLVGSEKGTFLAREEKGTVTVAPLDKDTGRVVEMLPYSDDGVLIGADNGWFLARGTKGKAALTPAGKFDAGYVFATRSLPGIGLRIEAQGGWFLAREQGGTVMVDRLGDTVTGRVAAVGDLPDGSMLLHAEKGWFLAFGAKSGNLVFARVDGPDVAHARRMIALRDSVLVHSTHGWFVAREKNGKVTFAHAGPFETTNMANQFHELPSGAVLIGSLQGLFVIRPSEDSPTLTQAGELKTGYIFMMREIAGGRALIGARENFFTAHDENRKIRLAPVGSDDRETGQILTKPRYPNFASQDLPDRTVLFAAERGLFAAMPRACPIR